MAKQATQRKRQTMSFFALQVMSGREDTFIELFSKARPDQALYNIKKKIRTRRKGKQITHMTCLFPGYVFFQSEGDKPSPETIRALKRTRHFMRILPATDSIKPLCDRDTDIIRHLVSFGREIGSSLVMYDENNRIKVIQGPLMGLEGKIVKVDRRKRRAKIQLEMNDSPITFDLGFDLLEAVKDAPH
ncbi:MAG TPA: hypothetical protein DIT55_02970 [Spirochaetaceae bacterium]|nr:hypothetical protein [Spirochaetaceae bacterium]